MNLSNGSNVGHNCDILIAIIIVLLRFRNEISEQSLKYVRNIKFHTPSYSPFITIHYLVEITQFPVTRITKIFLKF
jgi:hypothetical protein